MSSIIIGRFFPDLNDSLVYVSCWPDEDPVERKKDTGFSRKKKRKTFELFPEKPGGWLVNLDFYV